MKQLFWYMSLGMACVNSQAQIALNLEDGDILTGVKDIHITTVTDKKINQVYLRHQLLYTANGGGNYPDSISLSPQPEVSFRMDTGLLRNGKHLYIACAQLENDLGEFSSECDWAFVTTANPDTIGPMLRQTRPSPLIRPGDFASGMYNITLYAWDESDVELVRFYRDEGVLLATQSQAVSTGATGGKHYSFSWDTTTVDNGFHHLYVEAVDGYGNITDTKEATLFLLNSFVPVPPILVENRYTPTNLIARAKNHHVNVAWEGSDQQERYVVYRRFSSETDFIPVAEMETTVYVDDIPSGEQYAEYYITALYRLGESEPTNVVRVYPALRTR
ncbi:MAG: hypothetical protein OEZ68_11850 [Gammaproteobacteria bacterium]|nr:hypothetical protein [Gammaproteobacteria bacterium]MDH5801488.1 hypothetical protein [Gammaproteobacteria bacterium]